MYIHEAIAESRQVSSDKYALPFVRRKKWPAYKWSSGGNTIEVRAKILVANGPGNCFVLNPATGPKSDWAPSMDDLMADDWETCL